LPFGSKNPKVEMAEMAQRVKTVTVPPASVEDDPPKHIECLVPGKSLSPGKAMMMI
jgi:hypothetical protein